jgi:hypothetical protein
MGFRMNKVAVAVAATLGVTVAGIGTAQADEILFPYVVTSSTVTTLVSTINNVTALSSGSAPTKLHYRYWYKNGANAENNAATCAEVNKSLPSSANDVVTIDVGGKIQKANLGILFEDVKVSTLPASDGKGYGNATFSLIAGLTQPVRSFLVVDNNDFTTSGGSSEAFFNTADTLAGEAIVLEFASGAAWGYAAYNASGRYNANGFRTNFYDFSDFVETTGEVLSGQAALGVAPVVIHPRFVDGDPTKGNDIVTKFFVTPIAQSTWNGSAWVPPVGGQLRGDLTAQVRLTVEDLGLGAAVVYDRDEGPVSGQVPQKVTCVGAVDYKDLLSEGARLLVPAGGWSNLVVGGGTGSTAGSANTQEAVVIKLEYNTNTSPSLPSIGIINNAIWLRKGIRESVPTPASGAVRIQLRTAGSDINSSVSLAD